MTKINSKSINHVNDTAKLFNSNEIYQLNSMLSSFSSDYGPQIVVMTIQQLPTNQTIEEYSINIANNLRIGRKKYDDGLLILFSLNDRSIRIEVGYGLEKIIRDDIAANIIRYQIAPQFKNKMFYDGINNALFEITNEIIRNKKLIGDKKGIKYE